MNTTMLTPTLTYFYVVNKDQEVIRRAQYAQLLQECPHNKSRRKLNFPSTSYPLVTLKVTPVMKKQGALSVPKTLKSV